MEGRGSGSPSSNPPNQSNQEMMVFVKRTETIPLQVSSTDTINDVKTKLFNIEGVSPNMQELVLGGSILNSANKLVDFHIQNNSTIKMIRRTGIDMKLHIKAPSTGMMITVDVNYWDTIQTVKAKIQRKEGIGTRQMSLLYIGKELEDSETLASYNITSGSTLYAVFHPTSKIRIYVSTETKQRFEFEVKPWFDVVSVKTMIESILRTPTEQQRLIFSGRPMENNKTLLDFSVQNGSEIVMVLVVRLFVQISSKRMELEVLHSDTVGNVKKMIHETESIEPAKQVLLLNGLQLNDSETLRYHNIQNGSELDLVIIQNDEIQIFLKTWRGKTIAVNVKRSDSVESLKEIVEAKEGIRKARQNIIFSGKLLEDDKTLADYNIQKESTLHLGLSLSHHNHRYDIQIYVQLLAGKRIMFQMGIVDTIRRLKEMIEDRLAVPPDRQLLIYAGKKLDSEYTLGYYKIPMEATVSCFCQ